MCDHEWHFVEKSKNDAKKKYEFQFVCSKCGGYKWLSGKPM